MAAMKYTYSISEDFPEEKVSSDRLSQEIQESSILTILGHINTEGDNCEIWFDSALEPSEVTTLDGIVAVHSGIPEPLLTASLVRSSAEHLDISSTTSTDWRTKLVLTTEVLPAAQYRIGWSFAWGMSGNKNFQARVLVDGEMVGYVIQRAYRSTTGTDTWDSDTVMDACLPVMGFAYKLFEEEAEHSVVLQYRTTHGNFEAYVTMARLEVW